jgi:peptide/nickel transport system ATP-binding protein
MSALRIQGMVKRYPARGFRGAPQVAVAGVDLELRRGEVLGLIGESGSGKTTLVRAALGLLPFDEGRVELLGRDLSCLSGSELRALRRDVQLVFQNPDSMLNPGLTVREHLDESARLHRPDSEPEDLVARTIRQVGLEQRLDALPRHLSGGEKRRVGVARVLIADPALVVADEPTAGLDAALKGSLIDLLLAARGQDRATLLVSHDLPLMAYACDRLLVMRGGEIVDRLRVDELGAVPHHPYTESLLMNAGMRTLARGVAG